MAINLALVVRKDTEVTYTLLKDTILEHTLDKQGHAP